VVVGFLSLSLFVWLRFPSTSQAERAKRNQSAALVAKSVHSIAPEVWLKITLILRRGVKGTASGTTLSMDVKGVHDCYSLSASPSAKVSAGGLRVDDAHGRHGRVKEWRLQGA